MSGPNYCDICQTWPAMATENGKRCHACSLRDYAEQNPVPLPQNLEAIKDLASVGYQPAIEHLQQINLKPEGE